MQLVVVILIGVALWVLYQFYTAYNNMVKEIQEIKNKCIKEGTTEKEAFVEHISENYMSDKVKQIRDKVLRNLQETLEKTS